MTAGGGDEAAGIANRNDARVGVPLFSGPVLGELLRAGSGAQAHAAVAGLERMGFGWRPLGGKEGNFGLVNIGSDPALAFVERITNALDGVIERVAREAEPAVVAALDSPREAAAVLFGIPEGRLGSLEYDALRQLSEAVSVTIADGVSAKRPTLEVRDCGCGIAPEMMPASILDLAGSNKLDKPYLAGAYGQGGSTTFGFTGGGSLVASSADGLRGGVTYVRYRALDARTNKNGRYEFLVDARGAIAEFDARDARFERGTLVRHFDYELPRHAGPLDDPERGLLGLVKAALFDPVLPIRLVDRRSRRRDTEPLVFAGAARELVRAGGDVELRQSLGVPLGRRGRHGLVSVRYWLLADGDETARLRPDARNAVSLTNFGQTHDAWGRSFVVDDVRLPFLKAALVVQIELDALTASAKRELLSTTRDRLKRGALFAKLRDAVRDALADESQLVAANAERRRRLLAKQHAADHERLQRRFAELMETFRPGQLPAAASNGKRGEANEAGEPDVDAQPLPTLDEPTFVRFAHFERVVELAQGRVQRLVLESDAPDGYLARQPTARLVLAPDPPVVSFVRATDFRGGRARVTVRAEGAVGSAGMLAARLTVGSGVVLAGYVPFVVTDPPPDEPAQLDGKAKIAVPNVYEVVREQWGDYGFDERSVALVSESRDDFSILVNVDNVHLTRLIDSVEYQQTGLTRMRSAFLVQTAFFAFLQHRSPLAALHVLDSELLERYQREELDRVAQTVVSSIASVERIDAAALMDPV